MNVSRVYVFENTENSAYCSNTYEWCNKNVIPQINELQNIPYEIIPSFKPLLVEHGFIYSDSYSSNVSIDLSALFTSPRGTRNALATSRITPLSLK